MKEAWFYDRDARVIYDENRLAVARDVGVADAERILRAMGCEPDFTSVAPEGVQHPLWAILADMLAYDAEKFDAEPLEFEVYDEQNKRSMGSFETREEAQARADMYPGAQVCEIHGELDVSGADLVDAFTEWRSQLKTALTWPRPLIAAPVMREAAALFREYEAHHRAKASEFGRPEKAERNAAMAAKLEAVLRGEAPPQGESMSPEQMGAGGAPRTLYITLEPGGVTGMFSEAPMPDILITTIDYDVEGVERERCSMVSEREGHLEPAYVRAAEPIGTQAAPTISQADDERFDPVWED